MVCQERDISVCLGKDTTTCNMCNAEVCTGCSHMRTVQGVRQRVCITCQVDKVDNGHHRVLELTFKRLGVEPDKKTQAFIETERRRAVGSRPDAQWLVSKLRSMPSGSKQKVKLGRSS